MSGAEPPESWRTRPREGHNAPPLLREHMPRDHAISYPAYSKGGTIRIPEPGDTGPEQSMRGFDPAYRNIVDYIVRITHRIWEGGETHRGPRDVPYIGACYAPDSRVFDDYGLQLGNAKIIEDTHGTTGAFPNITLPAGDVIWAGDDEVGFHTSHRLRIAGTHTGGGRYGDPTGREVDYLVIANCVARGNDIHLEHVLYNSAAMLRQLGRDPMAEAERMVADPPPGWPRDEATWNALRREGAPGRPLHESEPVDGFDPDRFVRELHEALWNAGDASAVERFYADDVAFEGVSDVTHDSRAAQAAMVEGSHAIFSDPGFRVDEVYWMGNDAEGYSIATRWSQTPIHSGDSEVYGPATNERLQVWGITQQEVRDGRVVREWLLFNELDVMMQIAAARRR